MFKVDNVKLKEICMKRGLSQKTLAERTGITPCTISHYMSGQRQPSVDNLFKITEELLLNVYDIIVRI